MSVQRALPDVMHRVAVGLPAKPKSCHLDGNVRLTLFFLDSPDSHLLRGVQNPLSPTQTERIWGRMSAFPTGIRVSSAKRREFGNSQEFSGCDPDFLEPRIIHDGGSLEVRGSAACIGLDRSIKPLHRSSFGFWKHWMV